MGFTTGLVHPHSTLNTFHLPLIYSQIGGFTLTTSLLYLSLNIHARNRLHQSTLLHQQTLLLTGITEPAPPLPPPTSREVHAGVVESARDRWNAELERSVRGLQGTNWESLREKAEEGVSSLWRKAFAKSREGVEELGK